MTITIDHSHPSKSQDERIRFLILHYTASNFEQSLTELTTGGVSSHYLVPTLKSIDPTYQDDDNKVFCLVEENMRAWHAGVSSWSNINNINFSSIGIEIVNNATDQQFVPYPDQQIENVIELCKLIIPKYNILPQYIIGHSDIAIGRKKDPGPLFPWKKLYDQGIGAWFDQNTMAQYKSQFDNQMPPVNDLMQKLGQYGYDLTAAEQDLITAFQMHFRPSSYDGKIDAETAAIAYALCDKYLGKT